jgi:2-hydroxy-3-keto-5-methylthiopentenyl-1-phosphate phosphatase
MVRGIVSVTTIPFRQTGDGPRFLLLKRTRERGGFWQPVSGKVLELEGTIQTACRELGEETGITCTKQAMDLAHRFVFYAGGNKYLVSSYALEVEESEVTLSAEHDEYRWTDYDEAVDLLTLRGDREALHKLCAERLKIDVPPMDPVAPEPEKPESGIVFLSDFDGTITIEEASIEILKAFAAGEWEKYDELLFTGQITLQECIGEQFSLVKAAREEIDRMLVETVKFRPGFREFVDFCESNGHGLVITSGGLDFYIETLLGHFNYANLPYYADRVIFAGEAGMVVEPHYPDDECNECGNCKTRLVKEYQALGCKVIYIGDGISDHCPAGFADVVIARRSLLAYCKEKKIPHHEFGDFNDVLEIVGRILD